LSKKTQISSKLSEQNEKITRQKDVKEYQQPVNVSHASPKQKQGDCSCYSCYYCKYNTDSKYDYEHHVINKHGLGHPCYPSKADIERLVLKAQGKSWETHQIG
jgi:hypothetical protein